MRTSTSFALLITLSVPTLALAGCSSSISTGGGGSTSSVTTGDTSASTGGMGGAGGDRTVTASSTSGVTSGATSTGSGSGGAGGAGSSSSASSTSTSSTSSTSSSGSGGACSGNGGLPAAACTPIDPSCNTQIARCLPAHDNAGAANFGLRMADIKFTAPAALTKGLVKSVLVNGVTPNQAACNLDGGGTFSWLLDFDTVAGTVKTGGAKPATNPALGYAFVDQSYPIIGGMLHVAPVTLMAPIDAACNTSSTAGNLNLPVYLDLQATQVILFPLQQARFVNLTVSGNHDCIGSFNAAGLDPASGCLADAQNPAFFPDAQVVGLVNLDQADLIPIDAIGQTLCVVLSGDAATYGDGVSPIARCKRTNGKINFQGDWCTATNQAASAQCKDAVYFAGDFAASGVIIN